jgi:hypothetical protein
MTMAAALLMALMPEAGYGEILAALFGDLPLVPRLRDLPVTDASTRGMLAVVTGPSGGDKAAAEQALDDWQAYPAAVLAAAAKWRWDGSETALREAKSLFNLLCERGQVIPV